MKLYIYDHCPYCLKARMIFGLKNIPVELIALLNDDEVTPTRMIGQKMAPILQKDDSRYMPESMDIVHYVDKLDGKPLLTGARNPAIETWLRKVNGYANRLLIPRFAKSAFDEFATPEARAYFVKKKEAAIGNDDWQVVPERRSMLGIIQCKALNMLNPEKIVPEVRLPLRYRQSPGENRQYATDNRQPAVNKEIFPAFLRCYPWQHA